MAGHSGATFVADLQSKPWYPQYAQVFADAGIPEWIPDAIVANEDPSLSLTAAGTDAPSYGLFQINLDAHPGITQAQAENPVAAAQYAASVIQPILQQHPEYQDPANVGPLIRSLESAGWPGGTGLVQLPDGTWYDETGDRMADAENVLVQSNALPVNAGTVLPSVGLARQYINAGVAGAGALTTGVTGTVGTAGANAQTGTTATTPPDPFGFNALWTTIATFISSAEQNAFLGAIALALIAGGFVWLASTQQNTVAVEKQAA